jgi:hypothetical protein
MVELVETPKETCVRGSKGRHQPLVHSIVEYRSQVNTLDGNIPPFSEAAISK